MLLTQIYPLKTSQFLQDNFIFFLIRIVFLYKFVPLFIQTKKK
jgi:hypothetical protein